MYEKNVYAIKPINKNMVPLQFMDSLNTTSVHY